MKPYHAGERRPGTIKLSSNENPLGCGPRARSAIVTALEDVHYYPDGGARELREAIAAVRGCRAEQIIPGNGSDEVLTLIAGTYLDPGDTVLVGEHTFSQYRFAATLFGATVRTVAMPGLRMDLDLFSRGMDEGVKIVFLCSPNTPTGLTITQADLLMFLESTPPHILVVVDHAYIEYQEADAGCDATALVDEYPNLVVLRTFSKIHGLANLRIGYGIADPGRIEELQRVRSPFNLGGIAQSAAVAALQDDDFLQQSLQVNLTGKQRLERTLSRMNISWLPSQANFVTFELPRERSDDAASVARHLAERGFTVRPLGSFGLPRHLRITVGTPEQLDQLEPILQDILTT